MLKAKREVQGIFRLSPERSTLSIVGLLASIRQERMSFVSHFKRFDAYPKTLDDFRIQTCSGGAITVFSGLLMLILFASEIRDYLSPQVNEELLVDTTRGEDNKLRINFDLVVHSISCGYISLDAMDVSGEQHIGIEHNIYKRRMDLEGKPIQEPQREKQVKMSDEGRTGDLGFQHSTLSQVGESVKIVNKTETGVIKCGSCYGAETPEKKCCNTCQEVKEAYTRKTWKFDPRGVDQCKDGSASEEEERALKEGCQVRDKNGQTLESDKILSRNL